MRMIVNYLENEIKLYSDCISVLEIENKHYFYRIVKDLILLNDDILEEIKVYEDDEEIVLTNKIGFVIDYFNFDLSIKKYLGLIIKNLDKQLSDTERVELGKRYLKLVSDVEKVISKFDFNIKLKDSFDFEKMLKIMSAEIEKKETVLDNLFLLIDLEKVLNLNKMIVFINLKEYLENEELIELYKYAIYNGVKLLLIDSKSYGVKLKFEKKIIIDSNLEEFVL